MGCCASKEVNFNEYKIPESNDNDEPSPINNKSASKQ